jgi:cytochrome c-type biogenesis protein CcmH/NrfF
LPPASKWARNILAVVALIGLLLNPRVETATLVVLFVIWATVIAFNYDLVVIWWRRLRRNRQARKNRRHIVKQAQKRSNEGLSIFDTPEPEPAA